MTRSAEQVKALDAALQRGVEESDADMMRLALEGGASPDLLVTATNRRGTLPKLDPSLLLLALQKGADANAMMFAGIGQQSLDVVKIAVEQGRADLGCTCAATNQNSYTVAEWSYRNFNTGISDYLHQKGMNVDLPNKDGDTPLLKAVDDKDAAKALHYLAHGANPLAANKKGRFPLDLVQTQSVDSYYERDYNGKRSAIIKAMLKNMPDEGAAATAAPAFNGVSTAEDIEINRPMALRRKPEPEASEPPPAKHPNNKGFSL